jgi:Domain of unknown function (DUF397)
VDSRDLRLAEWRMSSYSANGSSCVEVAGNLPGAVAVRDSKNRAGAMLAVSGQTWTEFVHGIKDGEFDL